MIYTVSMKGLKLNYGHRSFQELRLILYNFREASPTAVRIKLF